MCVCEGVRACVLYLEVSACVHKKEDVWVKF